MWTKNDVPEVLNSTSFPRSFFFYGNRGAGKFLYAEMLAELEEIPLIRLDLSTQSVLRSRAIYIFKNLELNNKRAINKLKWLSSSAEEGILIVTADRKIETLEECFYCFYFEDERTVHTDIEWKDFFTTLMQSSYQTFSLYREFFIKDLRLVYELLNQTYKFVKHEKFDALKKRNMFEISKDFKNAIRANPEALEHIVDMYLAYLYIGVRGKGEHRRILIKNL